MLRSRVFIAEDDEHPAQREPLGASALADDQVSLLPDHPHRFWLEAARQVLDGTSNAILQVQRYLLLLQGDAPFTAAN